MQTALETNYEAAVQIPEDSHITKEEKDKLLDLIEKTTNWVKSQCGKQDALAHDKDPLFTLEEVESMKCEVLDLANKTLNKPKPPPKKEDKKDEDKKEEDKKDNDKKDDDKKDDDKKEGDAEMKEEAPPAEDKKDEPMPSHEGDLD